MPCSIGHSWWHMDQHPIQHSLYHGKLPARLQLLPAKTIHFFELILLSLLDSCDPTNVVLLIRISVDILLKGMDRIGAPKLMNISYILSTAEEKREKGRTHAQCQDPSHTWSVWHRWEWFFFEQTHFSKHINETEYQWSLDRGYEVQGPSDMYAQHVL